MTMSWLVLPCEMLGDSRVAARAGGLAAALGVLGGLDNLRTRIQTQAQGCKRQKLTESISEVGGRRWVW